MPNNFGNHDESAAQNIASGNYRECGRCRYGFSMLMERIGPRCEFIEENATYANIDA